MAPDPHEYEIAQKWAFGMAPPKPVTQQRRQSAARLVIHTLDDAQIQDGVADALSEIKGLFTRIARQDQWDWFTVSAALGYPSSRISWLVSDTLAAYRRDVLAGTTLTSSSAGLLLRRLPVRRCLAVFLGDARIKDEPDAGWLYYLSTREQRDIAKIGMTTRTVEERVREINSATGVLNPYGVRACWRVSDPRSAERLVHAALRPHRIRADREFFRIDYRHARELVDRLLRDQHLEIRTLDALTALVG